MEEIFNLDGSYLKENGLSLDKYFDIWTNDAESMTGKQCGLNAHAKIMPKIESSHCSIQRQALVVKNILLNLQNVLSEAVKVVNFIKLKHMNSQLFTALCEEMGSQFK